MRIEWRDELPERLPGVPLSHFQTSLGVMLARRYGQAPRCLTVEVGGTLAATWVLYTTPSDYLYRRGGRLSRRLDVNFQAVHGPVLSEALDAGTREAVTTRLFEAVHTANARIRPLATKFQLDPVLSEERREELARAAAATGFQVGATYTYIAEVRSSVEEQFESLARERKTKVRKAERLGLEFVRSDELAALREYHGVRSATRVRTGFAPVPWSHFEQTWEVLRDTGVYNVFLARFGERVGAGQIAFVWNGYVYLAGVSVAQWAIDERIPANDFLQWSVLRWAVETGQRLVDFVGASPSSDDPKVHAIDAFKARWGTRLQASLTLSLPGDAFRPRLASLAGRLRL